MHRTMMLVTLVVAVCICLALAGCGGSDSGPDAASTGSFRLSVVFPPSPGGVQTAVIYPETNSITVDVLDPVSWDDVVPRTTLNRPSPAGGQVSTTIGAVPVGTWLVRVQGWSLENGAGNLLSRVYDTAVIVIAQTTTKNMLMAGYPFSIDLFAPVNPVLVDQTTEVFATPKAVNGDTIIGTFQYEWSSSDETIAELVEVVPSPPALAVPMSVGAGTESASFGGVARGSCQISCKLVHVDPAPGQPDVVGTLELGVDPNVDEVVLDPPSMTLSSGAAATATATAKYKGVAVSGIEFTFATSNADVATVAKTGANTCRVDAVAGGTADINVTQQYTAASAKIAVTVPEGKLDVIISGADAR